MKNLTFISFILVWAGVFLFLPVNSQEQNKEIIIMNEHKDLYSLPVELYRLNSTNDTIFICRNVIVILVDLFKEYSAECYNDSTLVISGGGPEIHTPVIIDSLGRKVLDLSGVYFQSSVYIITRKWVHKEPTLKGFMEWLQENK